MRTFFLLLKNLIINPTSILVYIHCTLNNDREFKCGLYNAHIMYTHMYTWWYSDWYGHREAAKILQPPPQLA